MKRVLLLEVGKDLGRELDGGQGYLATQEQVQEGSCCGRVLWSAEQAPVEATPAGDAPIATCLCGMRGV